MIMFNPASTYRIQFHAAFTFKNFERILPYLHRLGVNTVYASPILESVPGSMHGYDTTNPLRINPEIGTEKELALIVKKMKQMGMSWIQDIVPNHMAFHENNKWLMDVLENGAGSNYASFFDINWSADNQEPVMVPFLGGTLEQVIEKNELKLTQENDKLYFKYHDSKWPVNQASAGVNIREINADPVKLKALANAQYYRLCHWQETDEKINYRRFFTVNGLICLNIQEEETFTAYHAYIKSLLNKGLIHGLRVDHIDGLYDPKTYLKNLRQLVGKEVYIVVEKILEEGEKEKMPGNWPVQGNTGYDFLALTNNLLTNRSSEKQFVDLYRTLVQEEKEVKQQVLEKKAGILYHHMRGELDNLYQMFTALHLADPVGHNKPKPELIKKAIGELLIRCPVYRFYANSFPLKARPHLALLQLLDKVAEQKNLAPAVELLKEVWLKHPQKGDKLYNQSALRFYLRCMQFSGPLMAKGVEDTLMYTYNGFIAHNEVGDAPNGFGIPIKKFHKEMKWRQKHLPLSLNATATHDTKRGEDVRARLNVLSNIPESWMEIIEHWRTLNKETLQENYIDPNDEYFIYQTLIGTYPMPGENTSNYTDRLKAYLEKALREGKQHSNWANPDVDYEQKVQQFAIGLLDKSSAFWTNFCALHKKVCDFGIVNSLVQLLLKFTLPGIPDVYQGTELWDLNLVDPDNRRPVDYVQRLKWLKKMPSSVTVTQLWKERYSGVIKLWMVQLLLNERDLETDHYTLGDYIPLRVKGKFAKQIFAFARRFKDTWTVVAVPLYLAEITNGQYEQILNLNWEDTRVILPKTAPKDWENLLSKTRGKEYGKSISANVLFNDFPMALLKLKAEENGREAGLLMHITSLPSVYGIGDFGPEAYKFIDFLAAAGQKYWQILPLNPISAEQSYSPYSSVSGMAGNVWLISPDLLVWEGFLNKNWLKDNQALFKQQSKGEHVDFEAVRILKDKLLEEAYACFKSENDPQLKEQFEHFCAEEAFWLTDFALYAALKVHHNNLPWYEWEPLFKSRDLKALEKFEQNHIDKLQKIKWKQFIFFKQWKSLKNYANRQGIRIFGDLPFYLSHDSADVWANRELFKLHESGSMLGIAGVPPDYFNANGQLWGMPVYHWNKHKASGFEWWLKRIRKNMELYDLLRLDHFRAFFSYWEVPSGESTAINGRWEAGPGAGLFKILRQEFPDLPFVAEDLGEIDEPVYALRDQFKLPGMKVLQFAFGENSPDSPHIPHEFGSSNFVVYTGTHDNNTTLGWYNRDLNKADRKRLTAYAGTVNGKNVHTAMLRLAYASIAKLAIVPLQDILGLDERSRMNIPASEKNNWAWCLPLQLNAIKLKDKYAVRLLKLTKVYGRS